MYGLESMGRTENFIYLEVSKYSQLHQIKSNEILTSGLPFAILRQLINSNYRTLPQHIYEILTGIVQYVK
jgi:hypothetical protein